MPKNELANALKSCLKCKVLIEKLSQKPIVLAYQKDMQTFSTGLVIWIDLFIRYTIRLQLNTHEDGIVAALSKLGN